MQLVIFDVDGTLTNTYKIDENCFVRALALEFGIFGVNTNWTEYSYTTDSGITQQIFQEKSQTKSPRPACSNGGFVPRCNAAWGFHGVRTVPDSPGNGDSKTGQHVPHDVFDGLKTPEP